MREYDRGLQAVKQEDWAEAERRFSAAIREDPQPQEWRRFQGVVYRPYVPHYYAGLAAFRRGDCQTAMQYWSHPATVTELGKPRLQEERAEHQRGVGACQTRLAAASPKPPGQTAPAAAAPASASSGQSGGSRPSGSTAASAPAATAAPSTPAVAEVRPPPAAAKPVAQTARPTASPAATRPTASPAPVAPAALRGAVEAWLGGRYTDLLRVDAAALSDARGRAQLHLFRAAAAHALALQAGQAEGGGLDNARQEVRAARAAQSSLRPDEVLFSPRFRAFWQQTR